MPRSRRQRGGQTPPACKDYTLIKPGDATPACGERVTVFGKANFVEYNFSIPVGEYATETSIRKMVGNSGNYTIYGGDGNVSFVFPSGYNLKLTIWDQEGYKGTSFVYTKTCAEPMTTGSCGQNVWNKAWTFAKSMKLERVSSSTTVPAKITAAAPVPVATPAVATSAPTGMKPLMALPAEPQDVAYTPPSANQGPSITVLDDNYVNAKTGQEGKGTQVGFPKGTGGVGYNIYDINQKLIGKVASVIFGNANSGSAEYHTITIIFPKTVTNVSFSGNPSYNANKVYYASDTAPTAVAAAPTAVAAAPPPPQVTYNPATAKQISNTVNNPVSPPKNKYPASITLTAPESVYTGATFTGKYTVSPTGSAGSTSMGFSISNGGSLNNNACVGDGCLFTAPTTPGPFTITYTHREANMVVSLTIQAVKKTAGGARRRRRTQRSRRNRRRRGSRRH